MTDELMKLANELAEAFAKEREESCRWDSSKSAVRECQKDVAEARAALQAALEAQAAEIERLGAEAETFKRSWVAFTEQMKDVAAERDALQAKLTAMEAQEPNKAALIGEFTFTIPARCGACDYHEPQDDCEVCGGNVEYEQSVTVPWTVIKQIIAAHNASPVVQQPLTNEADDLLRNLGLDPEQYRTDGGAINHLKVKAAIRYPQDYARIDQCDHQFLYSASYGGRLCKLCGKPEKHHGIGGQQP